LKLLWLLTTSENTGQNRNVKEWPTLATGGPRYPPRGKAYKQPRYRNYKEIKKMNTNELIRMGFEESESANDLLQDMCECCGDAAQAHRARGYKVCMDCYSEMGV